MDADTIMITGDLPDTDMVGDPEKRTNTIGLLYAEPESDMYTEWAAYQDEIINSIGFRGGKYPWDIMGNRFTDEYVREHEDVRIHPIEKYWPETYMIADEIPRYEKYRRFYFEQGHGLADIRPADLLMLHNSWTPEWYKKLSATDVLAGSCTMSNVLREILQ